MIPEVYMTEFFYLLEYRARRKTGDSRTVTSIQERESRDFSINYSVVFRVQRKKTVWTKM